MTIKYERRQDDATRLHYDELVNCTYICKGKVDGCEKYIVPTKSTDPTCGWKRVIDNDILKMEKGDTLTFPKLVKILEDHKYLEDNKILDEMPAHSRGLYVQGCKYMKA